MVLRFRLLYILKTRRKKVWNFLNHILAQARDFLIGVPKSYTNKKSQKSSAQLAFKVLTSYAGGQKLEVGVLTSNQTSIAQIDQY